MQTSTRWRADRLGREEVVEGGDRLQVGGGDAHHRGRLADALGRAPAVAALHRPQRRDRGRAQLRVARHRLLDLLAQLVGDVDLVQLGDALGVRRAHRGDQLACAPRRSGRRSAPCRCSGLVRARDAHRSIPPRIGSSIAEVLDQVGDVAADAHVAQRLEVDERRVAEVDARRLRRAVGEDEAAELAARPLDRVVDLARRARGSPR